MHIPARKAWAPWLLLPCALVLASCATMRAGSDFYPAADFSGYRSFAWMAESPLIRPASSRIEISPLSIRRVREAIERELAEKGFVAVAAPENADFGVSFTIGARDLIAVEDYPPFYRGTWRWGTPYYGRNADVTMYTEGSLAIDVFDNASRQPVWHGWARKRITGSDIRNPETAINGAVELILADFPRVR